MANACSIRVRGVVQGVGFRPFVYRLAQCEHAGRLGAERRTGRGDSSRRRRRGLEAFVREMQKQAAGGASIADIEVEPALCEGLTDSRFGRAIARSGPRVRVSPDLPVCDDCLGECFDPAESALSLSVHQLHQLRSALQRRLALPYDRANTTMRAWPLDAFCDAEYHDPANRRFHAQPVACPACGPSYFSARRIADQIADGCDAIERAAELLREGKIVAVKGLGGYHLGLRCAKSPQRMRPCANENSGKKSRSPSWREISRLRASWLTLTPDAEALLTSMARPIVLAPARSRARRRRSGES